MARRRKSNLEEGVNLDSLMDALTNVVAVLILVLILVQADVSKKVVDFLEGLEPATSEQVEASKKEVEIFVKRVAELDQLLQNAVVQNIVGIVAILLWQTLFHRNHMTKCYLIAIYRC